MRKDTRNWISLAEYDLVTAQHMLDTGRNLYALKNYPEPVARAYLRQTQELVQWLKQHPNLNT